MVGTITVETKHDAAKLLEEETGICVDNRFTEIEQTGDRTLKVTAVEGGRWLPHEYRGIADSEWYITGFEDGDTLFLSRQ